MLYSLVWNAHQAVQVIWQLLGYALSFARALMQPEAATLPPRLIRPTVGLSINRPHHSQDTRLDDAW